MIWVHSLVSDLTFVTSYVNNNKEEGEAAMTDFVKFQRHLIYFHRTG